MSKPIFDILDFETSNLSPLEGQILEVTVLRTDLEHDYAQLHLMVKLNPGMDLGEEAFKVNGITEELLSGGVTESEAFKLLQAFFFTAPEDRPYFVVAQFVPFDFNFLNAHGINPEKFICTRAVSKMLDPGLSASLKDVAPRLGIDTTGSHRSTKDVQMTKEVLRIQKERADEAGLDYINVIVKSPDREIKFFPKYCRVVEISPPVEPKAEDEAK